MADIFDDIIFPKFLSTFKSDDSVRAYKRSCHVISSFCGKNFLQLNYEDVQNYAQMLLTKVQDGKFSPSYACAEFGRARSLASFIDTNRSEFKGLYYKNPFAGYIFPTYTKDVSPSSIPSAREVDVILENVKDDDTLFAIVTLIIRCSLSPGECIGIKRDDFILGNDEVMLLRITKRSFTRFVTIPDDVRDIIARYIASYPGSEHNSLFINSRGEPLLLRALQKRFKKVTDSCNMNYSLNDLRNSSVAYMIACGASEAEAAEYIGISERWASRYNTASGKLHIVTNNYSNIRVVK